MTELKAAVDDLARTHAPCIVMACGMGEEEEQGRVQNQLALCADTPGKRLDELITALAGLKHSYLRLCQKYADEAGIPEQELHNAVNEKVNSTQITE
jgi:hypothetical protein